MSGRSTRAASAVERLKTRTGKPDWSLARTSDGRFSLSEHHDAAPLGPPLELDDFVAWVNSLGPQPERRVSKADLAFEQQLRRKTPS